MICRVRNIRADLALAFAVMMLLAHPGDASPRSDPSRRAVLAGAPSVHSGDPLVPMLRRMNRYFHRHEVDGVTIDPRVVLHASEAIRLSVISQLLGYEEIQRVQPHARTRRDILERADFLVDRLDLVRSGGPFDGMLGLSLLQAYEVTDDPDHLAQGREIVEQLLALPRSQRLLNGGLMLGLALAKHHQMTGDPRAADAVRDVLSLLPQFQHDDGSFPHWCEGSKDIHYTGWMAMELILLQRVFEDPRIDPMLQRMNAFLEGRVDERGRTRYEEPCPDDPGCTIYYYSIATGCDVDVDTRAFTNELGYTALLFDHARSPEYSTVMDFLLSLETRGTFADKWDYWPPPTDPYYPWTTADTSVVNMSVLFWSLAATLAGREPGTEPLGFEADDLEDDEPERDDPRARAARIDGIRLLPAVPNPVTDACELRFSLPRPGPAALEIFDAGGRRVRTLADETWAAGAHAVQWNRRDDAGAWCPNGLYFARLRSGGDARSIRVLALDGARRP